MSEQPILVEMVRGGVVESAHRGAVAVVSPDGALVAGIGAVGRPTFPRSAVKPLQALPLLETGAAARWRLDDRHIALACASHGGEPEHVALVDGWLQRLGLSGTDLECGAHWPSNADAARMLAGEGRQPCPLHNNCSGKHAGFLSTARHLGEPTHGYIHGDHPAQRRVSATLGEMTGTKIGVVSTGIDGCGIPTFALPLAAIASGMARLAIPVGLGRVRTEAVESVRRAIAAHPYLVAGTGRCCTAVMTAAPQVLVKGGAEGVYAAALPDRGLGLAIKIEDGAGRAAEVALLTILTRLGALAPDQEQALAGRMHPPLLNVAGYVVGMLRPAAALRTF